MHIRLDREGADLRRASRPTQTRRKTLRIANQHVVIAVTGAPAHHVRQSLVKAQTDMRSRASGTDAMKLKGFANGVQLRLLINVLSICRNDLGMIDRLPGILCHVTIVTVCRLQSVFAVACSTFRQTSSLLSASSRALLTRTSRITGCLPNGVTAQLFHDATFQRYFSCCPVNGVPESACLFLL